MTEELKDLKRDVAQLKALLDDPHVGLISWCNMVNQNWRRIAETYYGGDPTGAYACNEIGAGARKALRG